MKFQTEGSNQAIVHWNPDLGLITSDGGRQSPATRLDHEMDHAQDYVACPHDHNIRNNPGTEAGYDSNYDTKEERRVILGSEQNTALHNGESVRKNHKGHEYKTINPTSVKPKKE